MTSENTSIIQYEYDPKNMEPEDYLTVLLCAGVVFINNGHWDDNWPKDAITIHLICNDIFAWGCADAEDVHYNDLPTIFEYHQKDPDWGIAAWCIKKRGIMPQAPVYREMVAQGIWDLNSWNLSK